MRSEYTTGLVAVALLVGACAGAPKPTEQLVDAQSAIRAAEEVGADRVPQAQLHAQLAKEQLTRANKLIENGDNTEAERVLQRAKADAELAIALSRRADAAQGLAKLSANNR